ncbi:hypothetical protein E2C01_017670 [Portunus trituberculatus]|uniref:Uncharacterized protein n=1 Tax=Portunus trituberculatus TaxID=210409 RepID=A0A5B7DUD3_PORTR|nr:hypothetical protein [Portunus trituberculatus]
MYKYIRKFICGYASLPASAPPSLNDVARQEREQRRQDSVPPDKLYKAKHRKQQMNQLVECEHKGLDKCHTARTQHNSTAPPAPAPHCSTPSARRRRPTPTVHNYRLHEQLYNTQTHNTTR